MAKLFYSLEEAASKLKMSEGAVRELVSKGQLQEFRDRDRLMFKVDQIDMLAGDDDAGHIPLAESGESDALSLAESGSAMNMPAESPKEQTGISIFEADATEESDPSALTQVTDTAPGMSAEPGGSGLMELTREGDDTSLGAELLQDVYSGEGAASGGGGGGDALFDSSAAETAGAGAGVMMIAAEPFDGTWSGIGGGLALAAVLTLAFTTVLVIGGLTGGGMFGLMAIVAQSPWMWVGILGGCVVVFALIGMVMGKRA